MSSTDTNYEFLPVLGSKVHVCVVLQAVPQWLFGFSFSLFGSTGSVEGSKLPLNFGHTVVRQKPVVFGTGAG